MNIKGGELFRHLLENIISFDFLALKVTFYISAQTEIFPKSLLSWSAISLGLDPVEKSKVSSARINISLSISISLIKVN